MSSASSPFLGAGGSHWGEGRVATYGGACLLHIITNTAHPCLRSRSVNNKIWLIRGPHFYGPDLYAVNIGLRSSSNCSRRFALKLGDAGGALGYDRMLTVLRLGDVKIAGLTDPTPKPIAAEFFIICSLYGVPPCVVL